MEHIRRAPIVFVRKGQWVRTPAQANVKEARDHRAERSAGRYRLGEVATLLAAFAIAAVLLESEGLVTWAKRLPLGTTRTALLAAIVPAQDAIESAGFTQVRRRTIRIADRLAPAKIARRLSLARTNQLHRMQSISCRREQRARSWPDAAGGRRVHQQKPRLVRA